MAKTKPTPPTIRISGTTLRGRGIEHVGCSVSAKEIITQMTYRTTVLLRRALQGTPFVGTDGAIQTDDKLEAAMRRSLIEAMLSNDIMRRDLFAILEERVTQ